MTNIVLGFPRGTDTVKNLPAVQETQVSIPGSGRSPGEENGYPSQHSCLENSTDRGPWWATVHGIAESDITEPLTLSLFHFTFNVVLLSNYSHETYIPNNKE